MVQAVGKRGVLNYGQRSVNADSEAAVTGAGNALTRAIGAVWGPKGLVKPKPAKEVLHADLDTYKSSDGQLHTPGEIPLPTPPKEPQV